MQQNRDKKERGAMTDQVSQVDSLIESAYIPAIDDHRNHDALVVAILVYLLSRNGEHAKSSVGLLQTTASIILKDEHGIVTDACSFCGQKPPKVKLGGGGTDDTIVHICNSCVDTFHASFHKQP
jgi:hypothetical protein